MSVIVSWADHPIAPKYQPEIDWPPLVAGTAWDLPLTLKLYDPDEAWEDHYREWDKRLKEHRRALLDVTGGPCYLEGIRVSVETLAASFIWAMGMTLEDVNQDRAETAMMFSIGLMLPGLNRIEVTENGTYIESA